MPNPVSGVVTQAVGNLTPVFFSSGLVVLSVIGQAILGLAALFVLFYWIAWIFGWRVKMPVRPGRRKGIIGNEKKVHLERGSPFTFRGSFNSLYSRFWEIQTPINSTERYFLRPFGGGGGPFEGRASFGDGDFVEDLWGDSFEFDDDSFLDRDDDRDGFFSDPSYFAPYTSDSGPDSSPGAQNGGFNDGVAGSAVDREVFINNVADFVRGGYMFGLQKYAAIPDREYPMVLGSFHFLEWGSDLSPSWDFLHEQGPTATVKSASDIMRDAEGSWEKMFGWRLTLAPDESSAFSAETTFHALRIMEMVRMREMGFTGSYSDFWNGFHSFANTPVDSTDDFDIDWAAYDF
ncbi:MAG: hypothetical protein ACYCPA_03810 [Acidithiobacillus sp.]